MSKSIHKIVSHADDLDGVASAVLLAYYIGVKYKTQAEVMFAHYENVNEVIQVASEDATHLWISDLSVRDFKIVETLSKYTPDTLHFFDHHSDTLPFIEKISDIATVCFQSNGTKCAADLIWDFMNTDNLLTPEIYKCMEFLVRATHSRDLWINDVQEGTDLSAVIAILGPYSSYNCLIDSPQRVYRAHFSELMESCLRIANEQLESAKRLARFSAHKVFYRPDNPKSCAAGLTVIAAYTFGCQSDVGHMFLEETPRSIVALINLEKLTLSFRTNQSVIYQLGFGVNEIAKLFQGGGHTYAAGGFLTEEILTNGPRDLLANVTKIIDDKVFEREGIPAR